MSFWDVIFDKLSLTPANGLCFISDDKKWRNLFSHKIEQAIDELSPYAFYIFNNEPFLLFFSEEKNVTKTHQLCWNFNQAPVIFFVSDIEVKIFNGFSYNKDDNFLNILSKSSNLDDFSYWNLVSGKTWDNYADNLKSSERVDKNLLRNINVARRLLIENSLPTSIANNIIGRLIFIRYLIDRKVKINFKSKIVQAIGNGYISKQDFINILLDKAELYNLFEHLKQKFKGDLFPVLDLEEQIVNFDHLEILQRLFKGDELKSGQLSLFDIYDFQIIPIEFISNIYEYFMGEDKKNSQKAYYTPSFLVNYIVNNSINIHFEQNPDSFSCKVLDPTCGSGIFLVESLRRIINQYEKVNNVKLNSQNQNILKSLVSDNIFGIDKDEDAINVAMFSLYITLLDFQEPKDIEAFEFPSLKNCNFFVEDFFAFYEADLFENINEKNYAVKLFQTEFDYIIGNPPWGKVSESPYMEYILKQERDGNIEIGISDKQFAQAFIIRTKDFCSPKTKCAVVLTSKIFYNNQADSFRKYLLENFFIDKVVELSPVRQDVFFRDDDDKQAIGPAAILFYRNAFKHVTNQNIVTHISIKHNLFYNLFKIIVIEKNDVKKLKQILFLDFPWIWKVLVYGNILDFYFIKRLKTKYSSTIYDLISEKDKFIFGTGIIQNGGDENSASHLIGIPFLNTRKKNLKPFNIKLTPSEIWTTETVHRPRNEKLFQGPVLLIKKGIDKYFNSVAAISETDITYTDSITGIKSLTDDSITDIYNLNGIINSKLFTYYLLCTASSVGIEREQIFGKDEMFSFPYGIIDERLIEDLVKDISSQIKSIDENINIREISPYSSESVSFLDDSQNQKILHLQNLLKKLDESILELYETNRIEEDLIDYAVNVTIPIIKNELNSSRKITKKDLYILDKYNRVFWIHFSKIFNGSKGLFFKINTYYNDYFIFNLFSIVSNKEESNIEIKYDSDLKGLFNLAKISFYEDYGNLYNQRDIKGFNTNEFYLIKPNEFKCWHPAIAHQDLLEIREALLKQVATPTI